MQIDINGSTYKLGEDVKAIEVNGTVYHVAGGGSSKTQKKSVTPATIPQVVKPDAGYTLSQVNVEAIPDKYQDITPVTATNWDVLAGKQFVDNTGALVSGSLPDQGTREKVLTTSEPSYSIPFGKHSGTGRVYIDPEDKGVEPSAARAIVVTASDGKVLRNVTVSSIPKKYVDSTLITATADDILSGKWSYDNSGARIKGNIPIQLQQEKIIAGERKYITRGFHDGTGYIEAEQGGGGKEFNATFICPPYCHIYGTVTTPDGAAAVADWTVDDFTEFEVALYENATYVLKCDVEIPFALQRRTITVSEISFQTGTTRESYSFIPQDAVFFFGWENPAFTRQTVYYTGSAAAQAAGSSIHRSGDSSSTSVWPAAQFSLMQLNKQDHCYDGNLNIYNGSNGNCLAYDTPFNYKTKRYLNCWSHLYWPGESSTSTSALLRYDYHAQGNNAAMSSYSNFWAAAVGSGNHSNVSYAQVTNHTVPSGQTWLSFAPRSIVLEARGFIDLNAINYSNTDEVRCRFMLRTNTLPRLNTAYYKIYCVTYSDAMYIPPVIT